MCPSLSNLKKGEGHGGRFSRDEGLGDILELGY